MEADGCCSGNSTTCGFNLVGLCRLNDAHIRDEALYACVENQNPKQIQICRSNCINAPSGDDACANVTFRGDRIPSGGTLSAGEYISSSSNRTELIMQADGNLVLYHFDQSPFESNTTRKVVWASGTNTFKSALKPTQFRLASNGAVSLRKKNDVIMENLGYMLGYTILIANSSLWVLDDCGGIFCLKLSDSSACLWVFRQTVKDGDCDDTGPDYFSPENDDDFCGCHYNSDKYVQTYSCGSTFLSCANGTLKKRDLYECHASGNVTWKKTCPGGVCISTAGRDDYCSSGRVNGSFIPSQGVLLVNESIYSVNKTARLTLQSDGNLALYRDEWQKGLSRLIWSSKAGALSGQAIAPFLQVDGDLVIVSKTGAVIWNFDTGHVRNYGGDLWVLDDDGGMVCLREKQGGCSWRNPADTMVLARMGGNMSMTIASAVTVPILSLTSIVAIAYFVFCKIKRRTKPRRGRWQTFEKAHRLSGLNSYSAGGRRKKAELFNFSDEFTDYVTLFEVPAKTLQIGKWVIQL